ncbi:MAG: EVE domain-containing protein [Deltaproteobacteria bacterium]|nr:MAG: EVE domain-containing protein [Deltaproteobacteria bacterium]
MNYWLMKSEPTTYSIDDLKHDKKTSWEGVRNYQARNFMRDQMKVGDLVLFYHSNAEPPGVVGIAKVCKLAHPDRAAWDPQSKYFDEKASPKNPIWMMVDIEFVEKFSHFVSLEELKKTKGLESMMVLQKGSRLSVQPVSQEHFEKVTKLGKN